MATNAPAPQGKGKTVRLVYPQWQGGRIAHWITEIKDEADSSRGYYLGAQLLNFLAPVNANRETCVVPVSTYFPPERKVTGGLLDKDALVVQTRAALDLLRVKNPDRIITLGGECSVSVVPFTYLAERYGGDVAMVWIDAHPDITLPGDVYPGYHAMAVTACMGYGDRDVVSLLPAKIDPKKILFVGLRDWEREEIVERHRKYGIAHLSPEEVREGSGKITGWLNACGASRAVIHYDMDVLDPAEIIAAVGTVPDGLRINEAVRIINDISKAVAVVGLTVAEPMPRTAIRIKRMLEGINILNE